MKVAASTREKVLGALMIAAAIGYLISFVPRGWVPHDEGMLGQSAERVLHGGIPHIDYEEMYTGGLSWFYAFVFRLAGVDLLNIRWVLFVGASLAVWLVYAITRRYLRPSGAGFAAWVAVGWSFPNYFAGLPSWWLLICALLCMWTLIRFIETQCWRYLVAAGLAAGAAIAIKQTGVYVFVGLVFSLVYGGPRPFISARTQILERVVRWALATGALLFVCAILGGRLFAAEGLYLVSPIIASAVALIVAAEQERHPFTKYSPLFSIACATGAVAVPLLCLATPYVIHQDVWQLVYGAVILPRKRLDLANWLMPDALAAVAVSLPLLALVCVNLRPHRYRVELALKLLTWTLAIILPLEALSNRMTYQTIWQFARIAAALLPPVIAWQLACRHLADLRKRSVLFMSAAMLAWTSLNQFPFAAPTYFLYTAPLAVIAGIAAINAANCVQPGAMAACATLLLSFAVLSLNRSYVSWVGISHVPVRMDSAIDLPKAHLKVDDDSARIYRRLVASIGAHMHGSQLIGAPDCPEVYFLAGVPNPTGRLYDFLSGMDDDATSWLKSDVVVINHRPAFSAQVSQPLLATVRQEFAQGERLGRFEIRWR